MSMIDELSRTGRAVGHRTIAAGEARTAVIRRWYDAAPDDVWAACTEPMILPLSCWGKKPVGTILNKATLKIAVAMATSRIKNLWRNTHCKLCL